MFFHLSDYLQCFIRNSHPIVKNSIMAYNYEESTYSELANRKKKKYLGWEKSIITTSRPLATRIWVSAIEENPFSLNKTIHKEIQSNGR